jgi:ATP-dependent RNA/DNA helicase IGHMBP2
MYQVYSIISRHLYIRYKMIKSSYRYRPSTMYYEERLITPDSVRARPCILQNNNRLPPTLKRPCVFVNVCGEERRNGDETKSISNEIEVISVVNFAYYLMASGFKSQQVGIITFYASQVERIKSNLSRIAHRENISVPNIVVSNVDGFQGDECDITLISMVRTCTSVGFLNTPERINVAMTRAKYRRFVFGNSATLALSNSDVSQLFD